MLRFYTPGTGTGTLSKRRYLYTLIYLCDYSGGMVRKGDTLL
jgi:hypothetical protein